MPTHRTQLLVIGGGPGGYAAAFRAADLGLNVTIVDDDKRLGGTCLLRGCIPSKALLHVAAVISETREAKEFGLNYGDPKIDLDAIRGFKDGVVDKLTGGLDGLARRRKVTHISGRASFGSSQRVNITGSGTFDSVEFDHAIVATGSRPASIPLFEIGSDRVLNSTTALELEDVPETMLVVGGGYIGLELGLVYAELGSRVSVVEMTDGLLPGADRDLVAPLQKRLSGIFESIQLKTAVRKVEAAIDEITVTMDGSDNLTETAFEKILVSIGRQPNSETLGLENTKAVLDERGFVNVDHQQRTGDAHILAIGDVVGGGLAHTAAHQGKVAAEVVAGEPSAFDKIVPAVVFTNPEVAWVGLTETQATEQKKNVEIAKFPWAASGRAMTLGRSDGLTKVIVEPVTNRVLGVGIVGPGAGELIAEATLAVEMAAVVSDIAETIHPHPTLSESVGIASEVFEGTATDLYVPKRS
ncbi:MAG: dihydrolipoyl dehydrogenase [Gemmatimonadetes bacterium]|nr:dihydrolipoyl dehydrogenase [Gemmatimonadota bacterium]